MKVEFVVNGGVTVVLCPENSMEEELLKVLVKQNNELIEIRSPVNILSKTIRGSVLICKKESFKEPISEELQKENKKNKE